MIALLTLTATVALLALGTLAYACVAIRELRDRHAEARKRLLIETKAHESTARDLAGAMATVATQSGQIRSLQRDLCDAEAEAVVERSHRLYVALPELDRPDSLGSTYDGPAPIYDALVAEEAAA